MSLNKHARNETGWPNVRQSTVEIKNTHTCTCSAAASALHVTWPREYSQKNI